MKVGYILLCFFLLWVSLSSAQENCGVITSCDKCTDMLCTWCAETRKCIRVTEACSRTDPYCVLEEKEHKYLIGVTIAVDVVEILVMLGAVKIFYFPRRSRILARHARRSSPSDLSAFTTQSPIRDSFGSIQETILWADVSMSRIWITFTECVVVLVFGLPFEIIFTVVKYSLSGLITFEVLTMAPGIAFIFYCVLDKAQFSKINVLTQRGAYVINATPLSVFFGPVFTPYSAMNNVTVSDTRGGLGSVTFYGGGKSATGFRDIPAPHNAARIINEQIESLPQFAQASGSRTQGGPSVQLTNVSDENAPLLSGNSPTVF